MDRPLEWMVLTHERTGRPINVFVLGETPAAALFNHRAGRWEANPAVVSETSWTNQVEGEDRLHPTDRAGAEQAAREFGATLPSEMELRRLMTA